MRRYWVYILANRSKTLYVGVTNCINSRVAQHKAKAVPGFTARYGIDRLVYAEEHPHIIDAIAREKQIKGWRRAKKTALIEHDNPEWLDLGSGLPNPDDQ
jgi:putative endonuclease